MMLEEVQTTFPIISTMMIMKCLFDDHNSKILNILDLEAESQLKTRKLVGKFYNWLPIRVANIVDLYTFGKLNFKEIAKIKHIEVSRVEKILKEVKKRFRTHLE
ncbi:MAG: hypothetical protein R2783_01265 [Gelidibacter sp.]